MVLTSSWTGWLAIEKIKVVGDSKLDIDWVRGISYVAIPLMHHWTKQILGHPPSFSHISFPHIYHEMINMPPWLSLLPPLNTRWGILLFWNNKFCASLMTLQCFSSLAVTCFLIYSFGLISLCFTCDFAMFFISICCMFSMISLLIHSLEHYVS